MPNLSYEDKMNLIASVFRDRIQKLNSLPEEEAKREAHNGLVRIGFIDESGNLAGPYIALENQ